MKLDNSQIHSKSLSLNKELKETRKMMDDQNENINKELMKPTRNFGTTSDF